MGGVEGQAAACKKALPAATERFKEWALESKGGEFASKVAITFDPNPLSSGVGGCAISGTRRGSQSCARPSSTRHDLGRDWLTDAGRRDRVQGDMRTVIRAR